MPENLIPQSPKMSMPSEEKTVEISLDELSNEAYYALFYARAHIVGGAEADYFQKLSDVVGLPLAERKRAITKGLQELADRGIVSLCRNGMGEYEPAQVHAVLRPGVGLILREGV